MGKTTIKQDMNYIYQTFTPLKGTSNSSYGGCYYEVYGRLVHIHIGISGLTANASSVVYIMPENLRPAISKTFHIGVGEGLREFCYTAASTAGEVTAHPQSGYVGADIYYII